MFTDRLAIIEYSIKINPLLSYQNKQNFVLFGHLNNS